jgi:hypothetical protein
MSDVYNRCCNIPGLAPERIASYITNLLEFSQTVPFSQISKYIQQKIQEKERLEQEIQKLEDKMGIMQMQTLDSELLCKYALEDYRTTKEKLKWYSDIKEELKKYGVPVDDISKLAAMVNGVRHLFGYHVDKAVGVLSKLESLRAEYDKYQIWITEGRDRYYALNQQYSNLQEIVASCNQSLSAYGKVADMGLGLKELKLLRHTIIEIAGANSIPREEAVHKFLKDVDEQYDTKLGFERKLDMARIELNRLNQQEARVRTELLLLSIVGPAMLRLVQSGVKEHDIVATSELFKMDGNNNSVEEAQLLIEEVRKCGGIKAAIRRLNLQPEGKRKEEEEFVVKEKEDSFGSIIGGVKRKMLEET